MQASQLADLITTTLANLNKDKLTINVTDLQNFTVLPMMDKNHMMQEQGGQSIKLNYMYQDAGTAKNNGLFYTQSYGVSDMLTTGSIPWRYGSNHVEWETREPAMNKGAKRILDLVKTRIVGAKYSWWKLCEDNFWSKPADSNDITTPWGIDMAIVAATGTPSFQGGAPSGFTTYAEINSTTYPRWNNWAGEYTALTLADVVAKIKKAMWQTDFTVPPKLAVKSMDFTRDDVEMFSTYDVIEALANIAEGRNDNLGNELSKFQDSVMVNRAHIRAVPKLTADRSNNPIYGINWATFGLVKLEGEWEVETPAHPIPNQPTTVTQNWDYTYNYGCVDKRRNFILTQA